MVSIDDLHKELLNRAYIKFDGLFNTNKNGLKIDDFLENGKTLLMDMLIKKQNPQVIFLLQKEQDFNKVEKANGNTALHYASIYSPCFIKNMLYLGADPNIKNNRGCTILHYLARLVRSPELIKFVLQKGADPSICDRQRRAPIDDARSVNNKALIAVLEQFQSKKDYQNFCFFEKEVDDRWLRYHRRNRVTSAFTS